MEGASDFFLSISFLDCSLYFYLFLCPFVYLSLSTHLHTYTPTHTHLRETNNTLVLVNGISGTHLPHPFLRVAVFLLVALFTSSLSPCCIVHLSSLLPPLLIPPPLPSTFCSCFSSGFSLSPRPPSPLSPLY